MLLHILTCWQPKFYYRTTVVHVYAILIKAAIRCQCIYIQTSFKVGLILWTALSWLCNTLYSWTKYTRHMPAYIVCVWWRKVPSAASYLHSSYSTKENEYHESIPRQCTAELATSYRTQWRGALCHILHTRRWHRTVNWHGEQPDPLQLDTTWEEQSVHQHYSAGCQLSWEVWEECWISWLVQINSNLMVLVIAEP